MSIEWQVSLADLRFLTEREAGMLDLPWILILKNLAGWDERADDNTTTTAHWSGAGQTASAPGTKARQLTLQAVIRGTSDRGPGSPRAAADAVARVAKATLTVAEHARAITRQADVRVAQMVTSRTNPWSYLLTLSLVADDPLRYSAESRPLANGANLLPNRGDAAAFPRLALVGPHGGLSIVHPGGTWTLPALGSGVTRQVDFRERHAFDAAGARVFGAGAGSGPVPRVLPGGSTWTITGLGAGSAILSRAEAWS